jgi:type I restriction enzyme, S subunit
MIRKISSHYIADFVQVSLPPTLDQLDQSILAKAFRGELVPQDPSDEPASALLERIREQKAQQAEAAKRKQKTSTPRGNRAGEKSSPLMPQQLTLAEVRSTRG